MLKEFIWHVLIRYLITILVPLASRIGNLARTKITNKQANKQKANNTKRLYNNANISFIYNFLRLTVLASTTSSTQPTKSYVSVLSLLFLQVRT